MEIIMSPRLMNWSAQKQLFPKWWHEVSCTNNELITMILVVLLGLNIVEVAHDMQLQVASYIKQDLKLLNSFDTWHGMDCS